MTASPDAAGSRLNLIAFGLGVAGIAAMIAMAMANRSTWSVDFNQYYAAGTLAGTGHLYDWSAIQELELRNNARAVPFGRFPFYALVMKVFTILPYPVARVLFLLIEIAALVGFVALWPFPQRRWAWVAVCWSAPAAMCLAFGQDSILFLFFMTLGGWLLLRQRDFWAGVAFSICASKPHIAAILPLILVAQSRWQAVLGGVAGGVVIAALSFAAEGLDWTSRLMALTRLPDFDPASNRMPNLRGLLTFLGTGFVLEVVLSLLLAAGILMLCRRVSTRYGITLALSCGVLLSHHSYVYDCVLLIPGFLLSFEPGYPKWLRIWALFLLTPIAYLLVLTDRELPGHLAITGYTIALLITIALHRPPSKGAAIAVPA